MEFVYGCLVLVAVLREGVLAVSAEQNHNEEIPSEDAPTVSKRQTNFQSNYFNQQQIPQEYFDIVPQQTDSAGTLVPQQPSFGQQNAQRQPGFISTGSPSSDVFPRRTTTTLSPFTADQVQLQREYARRRQEEQQTALLRPRQRPLARPAPPQFQIRPLSVPQQQQQQQQQPLQFLDDNGQVRQQDFAAQQQDFAAQQQEFAAQQQDFAAQQQAFATQQQDFGAPQQEFAAQPQEHLGSQQQNVLQTAAQTDGPFSYAQVQFGAATTDGGQRAEPVPVSRPKGQRSVSRPRANHAADPVTQQTVEYAAIDPAKVIPRLLQNVVYVQPNGQMYKPIEDTEPVVQIPRKINFYSPESAAAIGSGPVVGASTTTTPASQLAEDEPVISIPRPKKLGSKTRHEDRKFGAGVPQFQAVRTDRPEVSQQQQQFQESQDSQQHTSEVEPDNFVTSLLSRFQQQPQQQPETTATATAPKTRGGGHRTKSGNRSEASKYLPDRNQLQLLQFPHELKSLSAAELEALNQFSAQIAAVNDKSVGRKRYGHRNRPVSGGATAAASTVTSATSSVVTTTTTEQPRTPAVLDERQLSADNRPVPTPVELNEQQRQFLASQGIRHLYRVDYDQSGNLLPLTYVLALDNRSKQPFGDVIQ